MTKTKEIENAEKNAGCGNQAVSLGTEVLGARCISYIDADTEQARKYAVRPRRVAPIIEVD